MVNLVSGIPKPLDASPDAPLMKDLGVDYDAGAYFMLIAPGGMQEDVATRWQKSLLPLQKILTQKPEVLSRKPLVARSSFRVQSLMRASLPFQRALPL